MFSGLPLIPAVYIYVCMYVCMRCVNIYICGVTINGEKRLGGATNLKRGMLGLLNACEYVLWCSLV